MSDLSKEIQTAIEDSVELFKDLIFKSYEANTSFSKHKTATHRYIGSLIHRYNCVQVLGMREPVPLKSLYVRANILEKISSRAGLLPDDLAEFFDFDRRTFGKSQETVDGEIIVNKLHKFIVLGKPGAGKTTYLKYLTLMMLDAHSQIRQRKLPIFVTLREWADTSLSLMDFIVQQFDTCGFAEAETFVERMLREAQCIVLFDGLDEVGELTRQDDAIREIKDFSDKYYDNQFIISCRVAAYNHWFTGFTEIEMADFNEAQMESFICNWFQNEPKVAIECWERLKSNASLRELASTPLLLTLLCLEYGESNDFPPNRAELYHRAIETLLTKWDSTRRIRRQELYKNLTTKRKESMLARIAWGTFTENMYFMREMELAKMIEKFIEHLPGFKEEELEPDSKAILKAIEAQHGIFVERAKDIYSFAHLTFQEYFTAKYIVDKAREGTLEKLVEEHLYDPKWKEVFLLVAGLLDSADELLLLMRRKTEEALEEPEINAWMKTILASLLSDKNDYPPVIRANFAAFIMLARERALDRDLALARNLALDRTRDLALNLGFALDRASVLDLDHALSYARNSAYARDLGDIADADAYDLVDRARVFDPVALIRDFVDRAHTRDLVDRAHALDLDILEKGYGKANNLKKQIILKIVDYLSANLLIIYCLESANFVSKPIREKMLHEMFLPKRGEVS